jgi:hypothetical protein
MANKKTREQLKLLDLDHLKEELHADHITNLPLPLSPA